MLRIVLILALATVGCGSARTTADANDEVVKQPGLVIEPLVPNQALPPGTDLHYNFAHGILPLIVFSEPPQKVREQFLGATADHFVKTQWAVLHSNPPTVSPRVERVTLEVGEAALIEMPPPQKNAQAYFALVVFKESGPIRYMTLERSVWMKEDAHDRTVVGEWSVEDGSPAHQNFGEGPRPLRDEFLDAVLKYVR